MYVEKIQVSLKLGKKNGYWTWRSTYIFIIYHWILLRKRNISDRSCREIKTNILCSITFFLRKSCYLWDNVEKILWHRVGHRWQYGACALHTGCLRIETHLLFSTATMVARTLLSVICTLAAWCYINVFDTSLRNCLCMWLVILILYNMTAHVVSYFSEDNLIVISGVFNVSYRIILHAISLTTTTTSA
jgi:hypothetical protein